ncbi:MAG: DNA repair protein RadC [Dehalococcoidia bacterium]|nr:DNA repair protein RadC [Dehalococcoidia bacterium]
MFAHPRPRPAPPAANRLTVRELPESDRPRERLASLGSQALSSVELLACLLGRGGSGESVLVIAQKLLAKFGSLSGIAGASLEELSQVRGVGLAKACQLKAACEIGRRAELSPSGGQGAPLETTEAAGRAARRFLAGRKKEHFILILLDSRHRILRTAEISIGTLDMSVVHPRETFKEAIAGSAAAIILAHNHPSGDPAPSREDLELTRRLTEAGRLLGIPVLDHIIVGGSGFLSLRAAGFLEEPE